MLRNLQSVGGALALAAISFLPALRAQDMSRNTPAAADVAWTQNAVQGSTAEIRLGELARQRTSNPAVNELAQRLITDHTKAVDELKQIAGKKNITVPGPVDPKQETLYDRLAKLSSAEFDKAYVAAMVDNHRDDVAAFQKQANTSGDPELKSFAIKTLPILQEHLRAAETLLAQIEK
jgi:putative membrane protein